jgi:hypothetical protein
MGMYKLPIEKRRQILAAAPTGVNISNSIAKPESFPIAPLLQEGF